MFHQTFRRSVDKSAKGGSGSSNRDLSEHTPIIQNQLYSSYPRFYNKYATWSQELLDNNDDSSYSMEQSSVQTFDESGATLAKMPTYQTHAFQQRLCTTNMEKQKQEEHGTNTNFLRKGNRGNMQWKKLSSFIGQWNVHDRSTAHMHRQSKIQERQGVYEDYLHKYQYDDGMSNEEMVFFDDGDDDESLNLDKTVTTSLFTESTKKNDDEDNLNHLLAHHTIQDLGSNSKDNNSPNSNMNIIGIEADLERILSGAFDIMPRCGVSTGSLNDEDELTKAPIHSESHDIDKRNKSEVKYHQRPKVGKCFQNITLVSPDFFKSAKIGSAIDSIATTNRPKSSLSNKTLCNAPGLANMVHPMNLSLFKNDHIGTDNDGTPVFKKKVTSSNTMNLSLFKSEHICTDNKGTPVFKKKVNSPATIRPRSPISPTTSSATTTTACLSMDESISSIHNIDTKSHKIGQTSMHCLREPPKRKNLASGFRSKVFGSNTRLTYNLSRGKKSMTEEEQNLARTMIPNKLFVPDLEKAVGTTKNPEISASTPNRRKEMLRKLLRMDKRVCQAGIFGNTRKDSDQLSILLLHPVHKVFEIVNVDYIPHATTVGDVLSKIRTSATDDRLAEQKYISLCNSTEQEIAAPMLHVSLLILSSNIKTTRSDQSMEYNDDRLLLVAIPEGYTAKYCQSVRRVLWANPKMQRWWNKYVNDDDPLIETVIFESDVNNEKCQGKKQAQETFLSNEVLRSDVDCPPCMSNDISVQRRLYEV